MKIKNLLKGKKQELNKLHKDHPDNKEKSGKKVSQPLFDGDIAESFATSKELKKGMKRQLKRAFAELEMEDEY